MSEKSAHECPGADDPEERCEKADEKRYRDFVDRCNRITDREIEENERRVRRTLSTPKAAGTPE